MTNNEALHILRGLKRYYNDECYHDGFYAYDGFDVEDNEAIDKAIKTLEQADVLDKIRAEIIELRNKQNVGVLECLDIIDKYRK